MASKKWKQPREIQLTGHAVHAELRALSLVDETNAAMRAEAVWLLLRLLRGEHDRDVVRDDIRLAAASALGVLAPVVAHDEVHRQREMLAKKTHMLSAERWALDRMLLRCGIATCAVTPCIACYGDVLTLARAGTSVSINEHEMRAHRDAPSPAGSFFVWLTTRLPALVAEDAQAAFQLLLAVGLPYSAAEVKHDGARHLLVAIVDDARLPISVRSSAADALVERKERASGEALLSRATSPGAANAIRPKHVARAVVQSLSRAEVYEELAPRLSDPEWRDVIIERLGRNADARFLDDALRLLGEDPNAAVILLDKLSANPGAVGERALEELKGFVEAPVDEAENKGERSRGRAVSRARKFLEARLATRARAQNKP